MTQQYTIADIASELSTAEINIRKYIQVFQVETKKEGRKIILLEASYQTIKQIHQLKNNGMSNEQIQELMTIHAPQNQQNEVKNTTQIDTKKDKKTIKKSEKTPKKDQKTHKKEQKNDQKSDQKSSKNDQNSKEKSNTEKEKVVEKIKTEPKVNIQEKLQLQKPKSPEEINKVNTVEEKIISTENKNNKQAIASSPVEEPKESQTAAPVKQKYHTKVVLKNLLNRNHLADEITNQSRKVTKMQRLISTSRNATPKDIAEMKADLGRRYTFLAGLRYIRDNWSNKNEKTETLV